jgi:hypothetical protein
MANPSKLEEIGIAARKSLLTNNIYNNYANSNGYSATHTNAMGDETSPNKGKGTGIPFDTQNGGSYEDIYGVSNQAGSGRLSLIAVNQYSAENGYKHPDTSGNIGQVSI